MVRVSLTDLNPHVSIVPYDLPGSKFEVYAINWSVSVLVSFPQVPRLVPIIIKSRDLFR